MHCFECVAPRVRIVETRIVETPRPPCPQNKVASASGSSRPPPRDTTVSHLASGSSSTPHAMPAAPRNAIDESVYVSTTSSRGEGSSRRAAPGCVDGHASLCVKETSVRMRRVTPKQKSSTCRRGTRTVGMCHAAISPDRHQRRRLKAIYLEQREKVVDVAQVDREVARARKLGLQLLARCRERSDDHLRRRRTIVTELQE